MERLKRHAELAADLAPRQAAGVRIPDAPLEHRLGDVADLASKRGSLERIHSPRESVGKRDKSTRSPAVLHL